MFVKKFFLLMSLCAPVAVFGMEASGFENQQHEVLAPELQDLAIAMYTVILPKAQQLKCTFNEMDMACSLKKKTACSEKIEDCALGISNAIKDKEKWAIFSEEFFNPLGDSALEIGGLRALFKSAQDLMVAYNDAKKAAVPEDLINGTLTSKADKEGNFEKSKTAMQAYLKNPNRNLEILLKELEYDEDKAMTIANQFCNFYPALNKKIKEVVAAGESLRTIIRQPKDALGNFIED